MYEPFFKEGRQLVVHADNWDRVPVIFQKYFWISVPFLSGGFHPDSKSTVSICTGEG